MDVSFKIIGILKIWENSIPYLLEYFSEKLYSLHQLLYFFREKHGGVNTLLLRHANFGSETRLITK